MHAFVRHALGPPEQAATIDTIRRARGMTVMGMVASVERTVGVGPERDASRVGLTGALWDLRSA